MFINLIEHMGLEPGRLHFGWISSAEAGKFVERVKEITEEIRQLGPATRLIKELPVLRDDPFGTMHFERGGDAATRREH